MIVLVQTVTRHVYSNGLKPVCRTWMSACTTQRPLLNHKWGWCQPPICDWSKGLCVVHADIHVLHTGFYLMQMSEYLSYDLRKELQNTNMGAFTKTHEPDHSMVTTTKHHHFTNSRNAHGPSLKGSFVTPPRLKGIFVTPL